MSDQTFCTNCGTPMKEGAQFCTQCGSTPSGRVTKAFAPAVRKNLFKQWWFWVALTPLFVIILIMIAAMSDGKHDASSVTTDTSTATVSKATTDGSTNSKATTATPAPAPDPAPTKPDVPTIGNGTFQVGTDIQPGLYKADAGVYYWARLKGFSGGLDDILANGNPQGQVYVEIKATDKGFQNQGSSEFVKIDPNTYQVDEETSFSDGIYMVGKDIQPGRYKGAVTGYIGYWARLKSADGSLDSIIANENPQRSTVVQISATDKFFDTTGMTWTKIK